VRAIASELLGIEVHEELLRRSDLYIADEAFLTGTAAEIVPITSVDDRRIGDGRPGTLTAALQQAFYAVVRGEDDRFKNWLEYVD
jgi:branched-chain amino acid aminotransferase